MMMEIAEGVFKVVDSVTRLNRRIRQVCSEQGYSYTQAKREMHTLMHDVPEIARIWIRRR
jgi:hypothetical protein